MQTSLADFIRDTPQGREADAILRKCVHCGFCTATCPTYQLLGDELDGPRGRIYLIKQMLEGAPVTERTRLHLDRCLTCRACESTCPSGVQYGRLADIGRALVEERAARRSWVARARACSAPRCGWVSSRGRCCRGRSRRRCRRARARPAHGRRRAMRAGCWCWRDACSPCSRLR